MIHLKESSAKLLPSLPYLDVDVSHTAVQLEEAGVVVGDSVVPADGQEHLQ